MKQLSDFIMQVENLIQPALAAELLEEYENSNAWIGSSDELGNTVGSVVEITSPTTIGQSEHRKKLAQSIVNSIANGMKQYHDKHGQTPEGYNLLMITDLIGVRLLRYTVGQSLGLHTDKYPDTKTGKKIWSQLSMSANINDNFEGGELEFPDCNMSVAAKTGRGSIFPSTFLYPHLVHSVTKGTRYVVTGWAI